MITPVLIAIGHSASGKSTTLKVAAELFREQGFAPTVVTDRRLLGEAVHRDLNSGFTREVVDGKEILVSANAVVHGWDEDPERMVFSVRDGSLLNEVHREMARMVLHGEFPEGLLLEWTTGPNVSEFPYYFNDGDSLVQDGPAIVELLNARPVDSTRRIVVQGIDAGLSFRAERNGRRKDPMDDGAFRTFFPDGGELSPVVAANLQEGIGYAWYDNNYDDQVRFGGEIEGRCRKAMTNLLEGVEGSVERRVK